MTKAGKEARKATQAHEVEHSDAQNIHLYPHLHLPTPPHTPSPAHTHFAHLGGLSSSSPRVELQVGLRGGMGDDRQLPPQPALLTAANYTGLLVKEFFKADQSCNADPQF